MPKFIFALIVLFAVYVCGCRKAGTWLVRNDLPEHADAIVLLMGGISDRVLQAVDLYQAGKSGRLIIVEESMGPYKAIQARGAEIISNTKQVCDAAISMGVPNDSISVLTGDARSTLTEAEIVRDFLIDNSFVDTLILVTSAPHTRRSGMIFESAFKARQLQIITLCSPSVYTTFDAKHWWRDKEGIQFTLSELIKIGSFIVFEKRQLKTRD